LINRTNNCNNNNNNNIEKEKIINVISKKKVLFIYFKAFFFSHSFIACSECFVYPNATFSCFTLEFKSIINQQAFDYQTKLEQKTAE
jgi:hypothetical protein